MGSLSDSKTHRTIHHELTINPPRSCAECKATELSLGPVFAGLPGPGWGIGLVSVADVNRVVDRKILPDELFSTSESRTFRREACVFIAFYFETADSLTSAARM